jgi:hypothetical protein
MRYLVFIFLFLALYSRSQVNSVDLKYENSNDSLQVTPNPFQKRTLINYSFTQNDTITLLVYNSVGQAVITILTNSVMPSGNYQDSLIMDSYPDGIYFVLLKLGHRKSLTKKIVKTSTAGIKEMNDDKNLKAYPNPVSIIVHIISEQTDFEHSEILITNALGQPVLKLPYSNTIDVSALSPGLYILKLTNQDRQVYFSKFVKE